MHERSRVTAAREQRGLTITELAARAGLTRQTIYSIETRPGHRPTLEVLRKIARALEVPIEELIEPERVA